MVEQMVNSKFGKYGVGKLGSLISTGDNQPPISINQVGELPLQKDASDNTTVSNPRPPHHHSPSSATTKVLGPNNPIPLLVLPSHNSPGSATTNISGPNNPIRLSGPTDHHSPSSTTPNMPKNSFTLLDPPRHRSPNNTITNPHFVYTRRKSDTDAVKCVSDQTRNADCTISQPKTLVSNSKGEGISESGDKTCMSNLLGSNEQRQLEEREKYWSERFGRLQNYLKHCDSSKQEDYVQRVRSLTGQELSKHAVELEKRAINLLREEEVHLAQCSPASGSPKTVVMEKFLDTQITHSSLEESAYAQIHFRR